MQPITSTIILLIAETFQVDFTGKTNPKYELQNSCGSIEGSHRTQLQNMDIAKAILLKYINI